MEIIGWIKRNIEKNLWFQNNTDSAEQSRKWDNFMAIPAENIYQGV